jgi:hypothetical protein
MREQTSQQTIFAHSAPTLRPHSCVAQPTYKREAMKKIIHSHRFFLDTYFAQNYTFVSCNAACCGTDA